MKIFSIPIFLENPRTKLLKIQNTASLVTQLSGIRVRFLKNKFNKFLNSIYSYLLKIYRFLENLMSIYDDLRFSNLTFGKKGLCYAVDGLPEKAYLKF